MKRYDDCLTFNEAKHVGVQPAFLSTLFNVSGIQKGLSVKSRVSAHHFAGTLIGNLLEANMFQRNLAISISSPSPTPLIKKRLLEGLSNLGIIKEIRKGYSFKTTELNIPKHDLTKIVSHDKVFEVFDPTSIIPSKAWSVVIRKDKEEIRVKESTEDHSTMYRCAVSFQRQVNVPIRNFKRIFNGDMNSGGRVYSNYQQMSKDKRSLIRIGGEETIELDYRYNQIRMIFALSKCKDEGDPYEGFELERDVVKKAINTMINAPHPKKVFCDMRYSAPFRWQSNEADNFTKAVYERYPILEKLQGSGVGLKLQKLEGDIALEIMKHSLYNKTVALPIHDSFIVKKSEESKFLVLMEEIWDKVVVSTKNSDFCGV
jgi:hypothetical protein